MTPQQQRRFNTTFGGVFVAAGLLAWMLAIYFAIKPNEKAPAPVIAAPTVDLQSCRAAWSQLGYLATATATDVTAYEALSADPKEQLDRATTAILLCKVPLRSFCMGQGCERPGLTFTVRKPLEAKHEQPVDSAAPASPATASPTPARPAPAAKK